MNNSGKRNQITTFGGSGNCVLGSCHKESLFLYTGYYFGNSGSLVDFAYFGIDLLTRQVKYLCYRRDHLGIICALHQDMERDVVSMAGIYATRNIIKLRPVVLTSAEKEELYSWRVKKMADIRTTFEMLKLRETKGGALAVYKKPRNGNFDLAQISQTFLKSGDFIIDMP